MNTPPNDLTSLPKSQSFVLTGGGTGGHVYPALAVADVLRGRGHRLLFVGTESGIEARLVPQAGFAMSFIRSSGLNRVGWTTRIRSAAQLPLSILTARQILQRTGAAAVFSMGGYVAGPVVIAALLARVPLVVMEPNATPGFANRKVGKRVFRALLAFEEARRWFPADKVEITGLPVRAEFFTLHHKTNGPFTVLITGGSRGARTLNRAARESWPLFRKSGSPVRFVHQCGTAEYEDLTKAFRKSGLEGEVAPFLSDMPGAFAKADLVVGRSGAGGVNEIAAAGMASVLVPFPFAADDHQRANAEALAKAGAARVVLDAELTGERLFHEIETLRRDPDALADMRRKARAFAHPGAAQRAADVMELAGLKRA